MKKPRRIEQIETDVETTEDHGALQTIDAAAVQGQTSLAIALSRAEIDQAITSARAYPRSVAKVTAGIIEYVSTDEETAQECTYALPRGRDDDGNKKVVRGPSIRFAEIVASSFGNCRDAARVVHVDRFEKYVEAEGVFMDLESGRTTTSRVRRRIFDRNGRLFNDDMIMVTGAAACAIARRNAIMSGVPKSLWRKPYQAVERVIRGDIKTLTERRDTAIKSLAAWGVTSDRIFGSLQVGGVEDIGLDELATLTAMRNSLKSGEQSVETLFPKKEIGRSPKGLAEKLATLAGGEAKPEDKDANAKPEDAGKQEESDERRDAER